MVDILLGLQWGDEGKGKVADFITPGYDLVARFQGGPNAGHSLEINGIKHVLNTIPSGIFHEHCMNLIGNGVVIDPILLKKEIEKTNAAGARVENNLCIAKRAHLILPSHRLLDAASEASKGEGKIGSTLRGISPSYQDKTGRSGLRIGDISTADFSQRYNNIVHRHKSLLDFYGFDYSGLEALEKEWFESVEYLRRFKQVDSEYFINEQLKAGKKILAEGAQGSMLDIDFGTYPYVTSSNTISAGACAGLGLAPKHIGKVYGIFKAYCTRVGSGPFPTELNDSTGELLRKKGNEFGATTGRPRRTGWIDIPALRYAIMLSGVDELIMMKADVLTGMDEIFAGVGYEINGKQSAEVPYELDNPGLKPVYRAFPGWQEDLCGMRDEKQLPRNFSNYISFLEETFGIPISILSVGPGREQTIKRK